MIPEPPMPEGAAARMHVKGVKRTAGEPGVLVMLETVPDDTSTCASGCPSPSRSGPVRLQLVPDARSDAVVS